MFANLVLRKSIAIAMISSACLSVSPSLAQPALPSPTLQIGNPNESPYDSYMRMGFAAMERQEYHAAVDYFRNALFYVPNDREATIAYWNARKALHNQISPQDATPVESNYDRYMRLAYDETHKRDYQSALINFQRALDERPGDHYASQGIRNVSSYIAAKKGQSLPVIEDVSLDVADSHYAGESAYDRYMRLGYAAAKERNYSTAVDYFRSAMYERPNDRLATIAFWNMKHNLNQTGATSSTEAAKTAAYDRYMRLGYDATQRHHFQQALSYFQEALKIKPNDNYAEQAISNVNTYIQQVN